MSTGLDELLDRLEREHRDVEAMLAELEKASEPGRQQELCDQIKTALDQHMVTEESEVYPVLAGIEAEMAEEAEVEHGISRDAMATLQDTVGKPGFGAAVAMMKAAIAHHVKDEEAEAFPKLRARTAWATKDELYAEAKEAGIEGRSAMSKDELADALGRDDR
jgi:iron-sulfur cluster repair protein YtfE (RIC family)